MMIVMLSVSAFGASDRSTTSAKPEQVKAQDALPAPLTGKVVETMDAGGYTYVCLETKGIKTWVAVPQTKVTIGQKAAFQPGMEMKNFKSKALNRTFESIYFSDGPVAAHQQGAGKAAMLGQTHGTAGTLSGEKISVKKAEGPNAYTVGEIYEKKGSLNEKVVSIRGKVVKVSQGIMGKNWIHLQDGTGDAATYTNDLVATSQESPLVGDIVTITGTVYKDKDFGAGYKYSVIMEQASIQR